MMNGRQTAGLLMLTVVLMALLSGTVEACPTCKQALAEGGNHANVVRGYFWSILFMMSMPFLILAGLGSYFYAQVCRARVQRESADATTAVASHSL